ncbi:MAG: phosphomannomutase [Methanobacteriaceae archaeon]
MSKYVHDIRGIVNLEITNGFASHLGTVIGNYVGKGRSVVIGRDFSVPSQMIKRSLSTGLMAAGVNVIDFGVAPIPVIHYNTDLYNATVMISITASHLRPEDVNIKIFSDHKIPLEQRHGEKVPWNQIAKLKYVHDYTNNYIDAALQNTDTEMIKKKCFMIVLDCEKGLSMPITPEILDKLTCHTVVVEDINIESAFPEPNPERLSIVSDLTVTLGANIGVVLDNDQDRVIFIDEKGNIVRDQTVLGIFAKNALEESPDGTIVSSVVASLSLDDVVSKYNGKLLKTSVNNVLECVVEENAVFGGDEPGMHVFPQFHQCFDGIFSVVKMLEILSRHDTTLSKLALEIPEYPRTVFTIGCEHEEKMNVIDTVENSFQSKGKISTVDGIRIDLEDSFILLRPSRFEPLIRVYIESKDDAKLQKLTTDIKELIENV